MGDSPSQANIDIMVTATQLTEGGEREGKFKNTGGSTAQAVLPHCSYTCLVVQVPYSLSRTLLSIVIRASTGTIAIKF